MTGIDINIVLSNVKRALDGTYHAFKFFKYAHRYLAEAAWRFINPLVGTIGVSGSSPWCRACSVSGMAGAQTTPRSRFCWLRYGANQVEFFNTIGP